MARTQYQDGTVFKQGKRNPMWYGRYREPVLKNGKLIRVYRKKRLGRVKEMTEKQARRALEPYLKQVNDPAFRPRHKMTFAEFVIVWREKRIDSKSDPMEDSTVENFECHLSKYIIPYFGRVELDRIDAEVLQSFVAGIARKPATVRNIFATLRIILKDAWKWKYFPGDIQRELAAVDLPAGKGEGREFAPEEVRRILAECDGPLRLFLWIGAETGLRAGELCGLRVSDVFETAGYGVIGVEQTVWRGKIKPRPKSRAGKRHVAISGILLESVRLYLAKDWMQNPNNLLFASRRGTPWNASLVVSRKLRKICDKLVIARGGLHALRHMNASLMDTLNAPLKARQTRMGHADIALTLNVYTRSKLKDSAPVADEISKVLVPSWSQIPSSEKVA